MSSDLLDRRADSFILWSPHQPVAPPALVIGEFQEGTPPTLANERRFDLKPVAGVSGLWSVQAADCGLKDGQFYHYWFEVENTLPGHANPRILVCDPLTLATDWRLVSGNQPSAVVAFAQGKLVPCDPDGGGVTDPQVGPMGALPTNNQMVIYRIALRLDPPTAWRRH